MSDYVVIRGGNVFSAGTVIVVAVSISDPAISIPIGSSFSQAIEQLVYRGYVIRYYGSDTNGTTVTLEKTTEFPIEYFRERLGETISVETDAGTITGVLTFVGTDYIQITEFTGNIVLIPISRVNAVA